LTAYPKNKAKVIDDNHAVRIYASIELQTLIRTDGKVLNKTNSFNNQFILQQMKFFEE